MGEGEQSTTAEFKSKMTPLLDQYKFVQASFVCSAKHQEGVQAVFQFAAMMVSVTEQYQSVHMPIDELLSTSSKHLDRGHFIDVADNVFHTHASANVAYTLMHSYDDLIGVVPSITAV
jgi:hypothetical protein